MRAPSRISAIPSADVALLCAIFPSFMGDGVSAPRARLRRRSRMRFCNDVFYHCLENACAALGAHGFRHALDRGRRVKSALGLR